MGLACRKVGEMDLPRLDQINSNRSERPKLRIISVLLQTSNDSKSCPIGSQEVQKLLDELLPSRLLKNWVINLLIIVKMLNIRPFQIWKMLLFNILFSYDVQDLEE